MIQSGFFSGFQLVSNQGSYHVLKITNMYVFTVYSNFPQCKTLKKAKQQAAHNI